MRTTGVLALLNCAVITMSGCTSGIQTPTTPAPATPVPAALLSISRQQVIRADGVGLRLSPDGDTVVWRSGSNACARSLASGDDFECVAVGGGPEMITLAWSPDGLRAAVTEHGFLGEDSDLWVWTPRTGELQALTDDGAVGVAGQDAPLDTPVDINPAWSPDGSRIAFARLTHDDRTFAIWTVDTEGGAPEELVVVSVGSITVRQGMRWEGDRVFLAYDDPEGGSAGGVAAIEEDGSGQRLLLGPHTELGLPMVDAALPGGHELLVWYYDGVLATITSEDPEVQTHGVLDVESGELMMLDRFHPKVLQPEGSLAGVALSPDGSKLAYLVIGGPMFSPPALVVRDLSGGEENVLIHELDGLSRFGMPWLDWPADQTITVPDMDGGLIVIHLEERE